MLQLDLGAEDARYLKEVVESAISDLRYEINNTDAHDFREALKRKKDSLESSLKELEKAANG